MNYCSNTTIWPSNNSYRWSKQDSFLFLRFLSELSIFTSTFSGQLFGPRKFFFQSFKFLKKVQTIFKVKFAVQQTNCLNHLPQIGHRKNKQTKQTPTSPFHCFSCLMQENQWRFPLTLNRLHTDTPVLFFSINKNQWLFILFSAKTNPTSSKSVHAQKLIKQSFQTQIIHCFALY